TMKTYHQYQSESKQAEQKLSFILQQVAKIKSVKKQKAMAKRVEKVKPDTSNLALVGKNKLVESIAIKIVL
ncbi:unnamed protein product, partial [Rotaria magnacalcarata]